MLLSSCPLRAQFGPSSSSSPRSSSSWSSTSPVLAPAPLKPERLDTGCCFMLFCCYSAARFNVLFFAAFCRLTEYETWLGPLAFFLSPEMFA